MPSSIEQALMTIVPTYNVLPKELVNLASALLAQSQSKASSLKPEEEIARSYVCAQLACERLKTRLGIDKLQSRPPVPPRIYKRLYGYLENLLTVPTTPSARRHTDRLAQSNQNTPLSTRTSARGTPRTGGRTPATPTASITANSKAKQLDAVTPSQRSAKRARSPSTLQDSVSQPPSKKRGRPSQATGHDTSNRAEAASDEYVSVQKPVAPESALQSAKRPSKTPLRRKEKHARRPEPDTEYENSDECPAGLRPGLGTMFQDALDWLSEDRTAFYRHWSSNMLQKLDTLDNRRSRQLAAT